MLCSVAAAGGASIADATLPGLQAAQHAAWLPSSQPLNLAWLSDAERVGPVKCAQCTEGSKAFHPRHGAKHLTHGTEQFPDSGSMDRHWRPNNVNELYIVFRENRLPLKFLHISASVCRPFQHVEAGLASLSARHAGEAGPRQLAREALTATFRPAQLQLSSQALGNRLACCRVVNDSRTGTDAASGAFADAQQAPKVSDAHMAPARRSDGEELLLARPSGAIGEVLQVYVLRPPMRSAPAVQLEVNLLHEPWTSLTLAQAFDHFSWSAWSPVDRGASSADVTSRLTCNFAAFCIQAYPLLCSARRCFSTGCGGSQYGSWPLTMLPGSTARAAAHRCCWLPGARRGSSCSASAAAATGSAPCQCGWST